MAGTDRHVLGETDYKNGGYLFAGGGGGCGCGCGGGGRDGRWWGGRDAGGDVRAIRGLRGELNGKVLIVVLLWVEGGVLLVELAGTEGGAVVVWFGVGLGVKRGEEGFVDKVLVVVDRSGHGLVHGIVDREGFVIVTSQIITTQQTIIRSHAQALNKQSTHV